MQYGLTWGEVSWILRFARYTLKFQISKLKAEAYFQVAENIKHFFRSLLHILYILFTVFRKMTKSRKMKKSCISIVRGWIKTIFWRKFISVLLCNIGSHLKCRLHINLASEMYEIYFKFKKKNTSQVYYWKTQKMVYFCTNNIYE